MRKSTTPPTAPSGPVAQLPTIEERLKDGGNLSQAQKFEQAAREHGADGDEEAFKGVLRKLAKPKLEN